MMLDRDLVAVSPTSVYRVLKAEGLLGNRWQRPSRKGTGFVQPLAPHDHWHIDFSYVNVGGTFYYLCSILDGCSRFIVDWEIREAMKEADAEIVLQRAREKYPQARPSDHLRQRAAIRGEGFQGVPSPMADDARLHQPALSSIQREAGAVSSDLEGASDSAQDAAEFGGCSASGGRVCGTLQHGTVAQRVGLRDAQGDRKSV